MNTNQRESVLRTRQFRGCKSISMTAFGWLCLSNCAGNKIAGGTFG